MSEALYKECTCCGRNLYLPGPCEPTAGTQSERERLASTVWTTLQDILGGPGVDSWACGQVADAIIAAGFGGVVEAWDKGYVDGTMRDGGDNDGPPHVPNPYRT